MPYETRPGSSPAACAARCLAAHTMLPPDSDPRWRQLVRGELKHRFANTGAGMLLHHLRLRHLDEHDDATLDSCARELHRYCSENARMMEQDIRTLFG